MSYHLSNIDKGELGELSKIQEELDEAKDAESQMCPVMLLVELSDLLGAVDAYLSKHHPTIGIIDLMLMANITARAFQNGRRN